MKCRDTLLLRFKLLHSLINYGWKSGQRFITYPIISILFDNRILDLIEAKIGLKLRLDESSKTASIPIKGKGGFSLGLNLESSRK